MRKAKFDIHINDNFHSRFIKTSRTENLELHITSNTWRIFFSAIGIFYHSVIPISELHYDKQKHFFPIATKNVTEKTYGHLITLNAT